ncbi:MAG: HAD-IIIA family hydrolase, partial [Opitutaceae bacterium]
AAGFVLVVATNQPDVGRGTLATEVVEAQHALLQQWIPELSRIEVCYDSGRDPTSPSPRRKPEPGMLLDAAHTLGLDLTRSWMIGDRWRDVDCGHRAGVRTVFIDLGHAETLRSAPEFTVPSFAEAVAVVLREARATTFPSGA